MKANKYGGYNDVPNSRCRKSSPKYDPLLDNLYQTWYDMIKRCHIEWQRNNPSYLGVSCNPNWYYLSKFIEDIQTIPTYNLFLSTNGKGWFLDKDILVPGNKVYDLGRVKFISIGDNAIEVNKRCKSRQVKITNLSTGLVVIKDNSTEAGKYVGCSRATISEYCKYGYTIYGYKVEYL